MEEGHMGMLQAPKIITQVMPYRDEHLAMDFAQQAPLSIPSAWSDS